MKDLNCLKFDLLISKIGKQIYKMFVGISMGYYILDFDLQKAYFLRDCLKEEIYYELKESTPRAHVSPSTKLIIYKKIDNGISEEITLDELIFYIHTEVAEFIKDNKQVHQSPNPEYYFFNMFKDIDTIKKTVENMKIILKYDNKSDEDNEELDICEAQRENKILDVEKIEDNETLAF